MTTNQKSTNDNGWAATYRLACEEALNPRTWAEATLIIIAMVLTYAVTVIVLGGGQ